MSFFKATNRMKVVSLAISIIGLWFILNSPE